jgi:hypothetical protein
MALVRFALLGRSEMGKALLLALVLATGPVGWLSAQENAPGTIKVPSIASPAACTAPNNTIQCGSGSPCVPPGSSCCCRGIDCFICLSNATCTMGPNGDYCKAH